jgi:haloacetate dehalogenase
MLDAWSDAPEAFPAEVRAEYVAQFRDPATVHAICEEYRAAATLDVQHDEEDRGKRSISCPVLVLWSQIGPVASWYDPLDIWRGWADDVRESAVAAGHFMAEEAPDDTARHLVGFLG